MPSTPFNRSNDATGRSPAERVFGTPAAVAGVGPTLPPSHPRGAGAPAASTADSTGRFYLRARWLITEFGTAFSPRVATERRCAMVNEAPGVHYRMREVPGRHPARHSGLPAASPRPVRPPRNVPLSTFRGTSLLPSLAAWPPRQPRRGSKAPPANRSALHDPARRACAMKVLR